MTDTVYYPYLGSGVLYARPYGSSEGLMSVGNASDLLYKVNEEKQKVKNFAKPGGGTYAAVSRINDVTVSFKLYDLNPVNMARVLFGDATYITGGVVTDETVIAYKGAIVPLLHPGAKAVTVSAASGSTTYTANVDYEVRPGGIFPIESGAMVNAEPIKVDYTFDSYANVEAITHSNIMLQLFFEGFNEALSGRPMIGRTHKIQLSPAKALSLISDKFSELDIEAEVLCDTTIVGVGLSQYFNFKLA